jgi:type I restriction enzyme S subunit
MADELLQSAFLDRFGDPLTNKKGLPTAPINELGRVVTGNTPPRANPENYGNAIEWIKSDNINTPEHFLTPADEYLSEVGKLQGRTVPAGSTLVTCIAGSPSVIGNAALADREVAFNQQINAVVPD